MKKLSYFLFAFCILLTSCDKIFNDETEQLRDEPREAEKLVGLWRGEDAVGLIHIYNFRPDRSATYCGYTHLLVNVSSLSTTLYSSWTATADMLYIEGEAVLYNRNGKLVGVDGSQFKEYELFRIYDPHTGKGTRKIPTLAGKVWTGYYYDKIVQLEFHGDGTMTRTTAPNAGWEGTVQVKEYTWEIANGAIKMSDGTTDAWGVGLIISERSSEPNFIFAEFGDVCCALSDYKKE